MPATPQLVTFRKVDVKCETQLLRPHHHHCHRENLIYKWLSWTTMYTISLFQVSIINEYDFYFKLIDVYTKNLNIVHFFHYEFSTPKNVGIVTWITDKRYVLGIVRKYVWNVHMTEFHNFNSQRNYGLIEKNLLQLFVLFYSVIPVWFKKFDAAVIADGMFH